MTEPAPAAPRRLFETTEGDLYRWQRNTLTDLLAFIDAHAPGERAPLPVIRWSFAGVGHAVVARLTDLDPAPSGVRRDPRTVLAAYAAVLGVEVREIPMTGKTRYTLAGRIGRPEGTRQQPRTEVYLEADIWDQDEPDDEQARR
jgi:hypothetical protein